jgi:hypothetical protein
MVERPHIFLFIIMVTEILFLEKYIKENKYVYVSILPILSLMLINLEAAVWPILFIILLPYLIDSFKFKFKFIQGQGFNKKPLILATIGMMIAGLINPYGIKAITYLFYSYGSVELHYAINEMRPADINNFIGKIIFLAIGLVFFLLAIYRKGEYRLRFHLLALGTAVLTLSSIRSFCFFIICGITPLSYYFRKLSIPDSAYKNDKKTLLIRKVLILFLSIATVIGVVIKNNLAVDKYRQDLFLVMDYLENMNKKNLVLYSGFNEGGYVEFRGFKTYIDPRAEVFLKSNNHKDDIMKEYVDFQNGNINYRDVLNKYKFTNLIVSDSDILYIYLDNDCDYRVIYSNSHYKLYERLK